MSCSIEGKSTTETCNEDGENEETATHSSSKCQINPLQIENYRLLSQSEVATRMRNGKQHQLDFLCCLVHI